MNVTIGTEKVIDGVENSRVNVSTFIPGALNARVNFENDSRIYSCTARLYDNQETLYIRIGEFTVHVPVGFGDLLVKLPRMLKDALAEAGYIEPETDETE